MPTFAFYHLGRGDTASCFSFADFGTDIEAFAEAHRILVFNNLRSVEICDGDRVVDPVRSDQMRQSRRESLEVSAV